MRRRTRRILILALCVYALLGIILLLYVATAHKDYRKEIILVVDDTPTAVLDMSWLDINPGETFEYTVKLKCKAFGNYSLNFSFGENSRGGLEDFIDVEIKHEDISYKNSLKTLLDSDVIYTFDCYLNKNTATEISITYSMPENVGNDAQNSFSDFSVLLTTSKE